MSNKFLELKNYRGYYKSRIQKPIIKKIIPDQKPDFLMVGAQKAGTSTLFNSLAQHPKLLGARTKEIRYFNKEENYQKGDKWYIEDLKNLKTPFKRGLLFEATPEYLSRKKDAERIHQFNPSTKIIIILRNPVKRAYSAWNMFRHKLDENPEIYNGKYKFDPNSDFIKGIYRNGEYITFKNAIKEDIQRWKTKAPQIEPSFVRRGIYLPQIKRYYQFFDQDQVLILGFQDLIKQQKEVLNKILTFLQLEESDWRFLELDDKKLHKRPYKKKMSPDTEKTLKEFYQPYNQALFEYLGYEVNW